MRWEWALAASWSAERSPPGTTTSSQVSSHNDPFTRLPCLEEAVQRNHWDGLSSFCCWRTGWADDERR